jgi:DNA-binding response OmpR family regulator
MSGERVKFSDSENSPRALVLVTGDEELTGSLKQLFESEGYRINILPDAPAGLKLCSTHPECVLLVDLLLPHRSGYSLCRRLLDMVPGYPIVALGPTSDVINKIVLLEIGVYDYISTPVDPRELLARVRGVLRWSDRVRMNRVFAFADVTVDFLRMEVRRNGKTVLLGKKAFDVLKFMITNRERVIRRQEFLEKLWNYRDGLSTRVVDQQIVRLRRKLETDPAKPAHFRTIHSIGYKFMP